MLKVSQLLYYPIKSLPGIHLSKMQILKRGPAFDRRMMLIDDKQTFLSQRKYPQLSLLNIVHKNHTFIISDPSKGLPELNIPEHPEVDMGHILVKIWDDTCKVISISDEANRWFSEYLNTKVQLVYQPDFGVRKVDPRYGLAHDEVSLSDGYPYLITTTASLQKINELTGLNYTVERFRPNIVIDNQIPFEEDSWQNITVSSTSFRLPKLCARCKMITIDPNTAEINTAYSQQLVPYRTIDNKLIFGKNACAEGYGQVISVGSLVNITNKNLE